MDCIRLDMALTSDGSDVRVSNLPEPVDLRASTVAHPQEYVGCKLQAVSVQESGECLPRAPIPFLDPPAVGQRCVDVRQLLPVVGYRRPLDLQVERKDGRLAGRCVFSVALLLCCSVAL